MGDDIHARLGPNWPGRGANRRNDAPLTRQNGAPTVRFFGNHNNRRPKGAQTCADHRLFERFAGLRAALMALLEAIDAMRVPAFPTCLTG